MAEYIERSAAIKAAKHAWAKGLEPSQYIEALPAADVAQVVRGRWIPHDRVFGDDFLVCSKCQFVSEDRSTRRYYHYCPHCGAIMDGGADHAVIVTRCKDCVHWNDDPDTYGADDGPKGKCMKSFETMCADDFCSYGERKDGGDG